MRFWIGALAAALMISFSSVANAEIRLEERRYYYYASVRGCDFQRLAQDLKFKVVEFKDDAGKAYYTLRSMLKEENNFEIEITEPCKLHIAEREEIRYDKLPDVYEGVHPVAYKFWLARFDSNEIVKLDPTENGYTQVLPLYVRISLRFEWYTSSKFKENLYQTLGPITLKGRLSYGSSSWQEWALVRKPGDIRYLNLVIDTYEVNGKKIERGE